MNSDRLDDGTGSGCNPGRDILHDVGIPMALAGTRGAPLNDEIEVSAFSSHNALFSPRHCLLVKCPPGSHSRVVFFCDKSKQFVESRLRFAQNGYAK